MLSIIEKLRTWGIRGAIDYLRGLRAHGALSKTLIDNARQFPMKPVQGVTVIADFGGMNSLSKVPQDLVYRLKEVGIPFQTFNIADNTDSADDEVRALLTPVEEFRTLKYSTIIGDLNDRAFARCTKGIDRYRIYFWEFESGLLEHDQTLRKAPGMIAMSDFNERVFRQLLPRKVPVKKLLYPFRLPKFEITPRESTRARFGLERDDFVVFYNFSLRSSYYRKNPDGAIKAFAAAFRAVPNAKLLFKVSGIRDNPDKVALLNSLATELGIANRFIMISDFLSTQEIYSITAASDVYLSLHRGEGFGLGIAEAMSLGVPVAITAYSSPLEFCNEDNSILIPYAMRKVEPHEIDNKSYRFVKEWAEPDLSAATQALKRLYADPALRQRLGATAQSSIRTQFSPDKFLAVLKSICGAFDPIEQIGHH